MRPRCREIQAQAAGLASLAPADRERRAAEAHALTCAACAAALAEGGAVLSLVDEALPIAAPRPESLAVARQEILAELAASPRPTVRLRGSPAGARPSVAVGAALAALPLASVAMVLLQGGAAGPQPAIGVKCAAFELGFALAPMVMALVLARRRAVSRPVAVVAAGAALGALIGQAALFAACHATPSTSHAFVFHTLPVLLALALGAIAGMGARRIGGSRGAAQAP